jgi:hypothetical protein
VDVEHGAAPAALAGLDGPTVARDDRLAGRERERVGARRALRDLISVPRFATSIDTAWPLRFAVISIGVPAGVWVAA